VQKRLRRKPLSGVCWIETERHLGTSIVRLSGEFDVSAESAFGESIDRAVDAGTATLVFDLRGLTFMDSTGLRILVSLNNRCEKDEIDFAVLCGDGPVLDVLRETGLDGVIPVVDPSGALKPAESPV
jgi:anti-sigma B factor antagonist